MSNGSLYHLIIRTDYTLFINLIMNCSDDNKKMELRFYGNIL